MNKKQIEALAAAVTALRANGFDTVSEAAIFCTAAVATAAGQPLDLSGIRRIAEVPMTSASRIAWDLHERGMVEYVADPKDRRRKLVHAKLEAFK